MYILLSGVPPFFGNTDPEILDSVKLGKYSFNSKIILSLFLKIIDKKVPEFENVTETAKDLIKKMLVKPTQRLTSSQVLKHPWLKEDKNLMNSNLKFNWNSLKSFNNYDKLKKATLTFIASQLSENEITELGKLFKKIDKNGDGVLTIDEMKTGY